MIARTNDFKNEIKKLGREIDFKIALHTNDKIITEDNKFLMTESNLHLVVEQLDTEEIDELITAEDIFNATISRKGNLLSTMMKEFDFEISQDLRVGDVVDCSFGLKVNDDYEYINYGKFIIFSKEHNEDTDSYSYVAYDSMLLSMKDVDDFTLIQGVTVQQAIENICEKIGLAVNITAEDIESLPNLEKVINENTFSNLEITYRDVLDNICQCLGITMVSNNKNLYLKVLNRNSVDTFDEEYLKNINVKFGEKYGPINSVTLSRSDDTDIIYRKDDASIELNGLCEFKIKDNPIMLYDDREDYIDEIFEQLNGVEFYVNDFSSPGIAYLEPLDFYNIIVGENTYKCLLLNDEIKVQQGLEESIYTEMPEETTTDYKTSSKTDKEVSFIVDKQNGKINAKVSQDDIIASLNVAVEDGQGIVELKGNTVTIDSDYFTLNENGRIEATSGKIGGFELNTNNFDVNLDGIYDYNYFDMSLVAMIMTNTIYKDSHIQNVLDSEGSGDVSAADYVRIRNIINETVENTKKLQGSFEINSNDTKNCVSVKDENGEVVTSIGLGGLNSTYITCSNFVCGYPGQTYSDGNFVSMNGNTGNITCVSLTQTSKEESKKNFEKYENALEQVKNTDIYKYNLKNENDDSKKHIGFVIGGDFNYSHDITATNENNEEVGVDTYSMVSVLWKAVQEQQEQIEELKKEIKSLKGDDI